MKIRCPSCNVAYEVEYAKIPEKGVHARCSRCKAKFTLQKIFRNNSEDSFFALAALASDGANDILSIYTNDSKEFLIWLRKLVLEKEELLRYKSGLIDTKLKLENTVNELSKTQAKLGMVEDKLRRIRKMSWWKRLFWRE